MCTVTCWELYANKARTFCGPASCSWAFHAGPSPPAVPLGWPTFASSSLLGRGSWLPMLAFEIQGIVFLAQLTSHVASSRLVMAVLLSPPCSACPEMEDAWRKYFLFTQCCVLIISGDVTVANKLDASSFYFLHGSWNSL